MIISAIQQFIASMSLMSGTAFVVLLCALIGWLLGSIRSPIWAYLSAVGVALVITCVLYWLPVLLGQEAGELGAWFLLFLVIWFPAGTLAAFIMIYFRRK